MTPGTPRNLRHYCPGPSIAATRRAFSAALHRRRRSTEVMTSTRSIVMSLTSASHRSYAALRSSQGGTARRRTKAKREPEVEPNRPVNDLRREPISGVADFRHALWLPSCRRRDNAVRGAEGGSRKASSGRQRAHGRPSCVLYCSDVSEQSESACLASSASAGARFKFNACCSISLHSLSCLS